MALKQIKSLVQFARGTSVVLSSLAAPIPDGVVVFSIDDGVFKMGDGGTMYSALPTMFTYSDLVSAQGGLSNLFQETNIDMNGKIALVKFDQLTNKVYYGVSDVSLQTILDAISQLESENTTQDTDIAALLNKALSIDVGINTAPNNNIVAINSRRYSNSGTSISAIQAQIAASASFEEGSHLLEPVFYTGQNKLKEADKENLIDGNTYYVDIKGFNNNVDTLVYTCTAANSNVVINQVSGSLFSIQLNNVTAGVKDNIPFAIIVGIDNVESTSPMRKAIACLAVRQRIIVGVYGGSYNENFQDIAIDSKNNIYAIGYTSSEGASATSYTSALIVKFDTDLNILARKVYSGSSTDIFRSIIVDPNDNLYVVGNTISEGASAASYSSAFIVKFNSSLNILARKVYGGTSTDVFQGVTFDSYSNIYAVGYTRSEGSGSDDALIVKFDSSLNKLAGEVYGGSGGDDRFNGVNIDSSNNIYAVGYTISEGSGSNDALIVKFDSSLNKLAGKRYGGVGADQFVDVDIDSSNNVYTIGFTASEGLGGYESFIIKFDSSLNKLDGKRYGGSGGDTFYGVNVDSSDNVCAVGNTSSEGSSGEALIVKFDSSLNKISSKRYGGSSSELFFNVINDTFDNIYAVGNTESEGSGGVDAIIVKLPPITPSGTFTGTILTGLTLADSALTSSDSALTLADSALTLADSVLTLSNSTLTLSDSALTYEKDYLN